MKPGQLRSDFQASILNRRHYAMDRSIASERQQVRTGLHGGLYDFCELLKPVLKRTHLADAG